MVNIGDPLPDFTLPDENGNQVDIGQYKGKSPLIIYFYPKDDTPGCTMEACGFRDNFGEFELKGVTIFGISSDGSSSHVRFRQKYSLPFSLLSDEDSVVQKIFGVTKTLWLFPGRVTYVIDKSGIVRNIFNSQIFPKRHVLEALETINQF